jgi:molecular chaperone DnaJ
MSKNLYITLGVDKSATDSEIKKAYRTLAKKYHPDKNPDDDEAEVKFKEVAEAYETLSDSNKKARYDSLGHDAYMNNGQGREGYGSNNMRDVFDSIRKQQQEVANKRRYTITQSITLTMEEVYHGVTKTFKYKRLLKCQPCNGKGGEDIVRCTTCNGKGVRYRVIDTQHGRMQETISCSNCDGRGFKINNTCKSCSGSGMSKKEDTIDVKIPHGVMPNQQILLQGSGHYYVDENGSNSGDLVIIIAINEEKFTILKDFGLLSKIELPYETMVLGGAFEFKTIDGSIVKVPVSKLSNIGHKLKLKSKGLKYMNYDVMRGDQYIMVDLKFPKSITEEEEKILTELKKISE